jgi:FkbM family methyltransferase
MKKIKFFFAPIAILIVDIIWEIYSKILKLNVTYNSKLVKFFMYPVGHISKEIFRENFFSKFEYKERVFIENFVTNNSNVVNIGANIGFYTLLCATISKEGKVFSIEPSTNNFKNLNNNIELNALTNVVAYNVGIGDFDGEMKLYKDVSNPTLDSHYTVVNDNSDNIVLEKILINKLDSLLPELPNIDLVIMDVEGYEFEALSGAILFLKTYPNVTFLIELTKNHDKVINLMESFGLKPFTILGNGLLSPAVNYHGNLIFKKL